MHQDTRQLKKNKEKSKAWALTASLSSDQGLSSLLCGRQMPELTPSVLLRKALKGPSDSLIVRAQPRVLETPTAARLRATHSSCTEHQYLSAACFIDQKKSSYFQIYIYLQIFEFHLKGWMCHLFPLETPSLSQTQKLQGLLELHATPSQKGEEGVGGQRRNKKIM